MEIKNEIQAPTFAVFVFDQKGGIVVRKTRSRTEISEVAKGSILVEAANLIPIVGFKETQEVDKEVVNFDGGLIGEGRQANFNGE